MSLKIATNNAPAYAYLSEGDGSNPAASAATVNGTGGTSIGTVLLLYLIATTYNYTGISVTPVNEEAGVNWQVSLNGSAWAETVSPADMDARAGDQVIAIYLRPVVNNDGSVPVGTYTACNIEVAATAAP